MRMAYYRTYAPTKGVDTSLGLPAGPNSGLSVRLS